MPVCREAMPGVEWLNDHHWVRCYLHGPGENPHPTDDV
jgi:hypothetical protein